ncbi:MAG TPA: class I SAM-dependent methyltransferase [Candidatus Paceibacterota bacterium]|nr:class I SAM-dependent methyltransferase [Candidatus Paceibacterota bacterium]
MPVMQADPPSVCPLCKMQHPVSLHEAHEDSGVRYDLYECEACRVQFWWPLKNPGATWYEHDIRYEGRNHDPILTPNEKHRGTISYFAPNHGTVLDVGCGVGNFLAHAAQKGWNVSGIDFDHDGIEAAKKTFGLKDLEVADVIEYKKRHPEKSFDLVTFFDVLEHIDNHNEFIETVKSLLVTDGYISLSMPYRHAWRWLIPADLPPRHLTRWDDASVEKFLSDRGFAVRHIVHLPASFYFIVVKLRFSRYGRFFTFGAVRKAKESAAHQGVAVPGRSIKVRTIHALAKVKDIMLFGIPAGVIWLLLLPSQGRYTDFYVIAQKV